MVLFLTWNSEDLYLTTTIRIWMMIWKWQLQPFTNPQLKSQPINSVFLPQQNQQKFPNWIILKFRQMVLEMSFPPTLLRNEFFHIFLKFLRLSSDFYKISDRLWPFHLFSRYVYSLLFTTVCLILVVIFGTQWFQCHRSQKHHFWLFRRFLAGYLNITL